MRRTSPWDHSSKNNNDSFDGEVPVIALDRVLDIFGEGGKRSILFVLQARHNINTAGEWISLNSLEPALASMFGEGSDIVMAMLRHSQQEKRLEEI